MLRNYTGGATNSKEAPEMAEVKFGLCINHEEDIFMYQKTLTLNWYKNHFNNFCSS